MTDIEAAKMVREVATFCQQQQRRITELERELAACTKSRQKRNAELEEAQQTLNAVLADLKQRNHEREMNKDVACALKQRDDLKAEVEAIRAAIAPFLKKAEAELPLAEAVRVRIERERRDTDTVLTLLAKAKFEAEALRKDKELLDGAADIRIVDGIGGIDIDGATSAAIPKDANFDDEEIWKIEWRNQFRIALRAAIDAAIPAAREGK